MFTLDYRRFLSPGLPRPAPLMHSELPLMRRSCRSTKSALCRLVLALWFGLMAWYVVAALDPAALQRQLIASFGPARVVLLGDWLQMVSTAKTLGDESRLRQINDFVNQNIAFEDDISVWQQSDYWATPLETIGQGRGDCEDFAIIKYVSLRLAGIPDSKLRLTYVKARLKTPSGTMQQAHMVLTYYATPNAEPLVLDNLDSTIRPASRRPDLQPVFSFNSEGIFAGVAGNEKASAGSLGRLSRWEDVLRRIRAEGYE
jgi:predicted transglutaminase-like cysteine proteinase